MSVKSRDFGHGASFIMGARDLGIELLEAVLEIVDNSIDAGAENIHVNVEKNGEYIRIYVEDDGSGIAKEFEEDGTVYDGITYALAFGDRYNQGSGQIGKFGWGLPSSATCTSIRTEVYTRQKDEDNWRYTYVDLEEMESSGDTRPPISEQSEPDHLDLENQNPDSGTIVSFEKCDNPEPKTVNGIVSMLTRELPQVYRYFLQGDKVITINGTELQPKDPLFMMENAHNVGELPDKVPQVEEPYHKNTIQLKEVNGENTHPVILTVVWLDVEAIRTCDEYRGGELMSDLGLVESNQGFSLVRNGREIRSDRDFGLFKRNADKNYMRAEIRFPPELDERFGIQTNKSRLSMKESTKDKLREGLDNAPNQIMRKTRKKITKLKSEAHKEEDDGEPSPSELAAEEAAKFLNKPREQTEEERKRVENKIEEEKEKEIEEIEENKELDKKEKEKEKEKTEKKYERQKNSNSYNVTTDTIGRGHFYEPDFRGNQVNAIINDGHNFYDVYNKIRTGAYRIDQPVSPDGGVEEMVEEQTEASILIDHILLSAARAELRMQSRDDYDEEIEEYIHQFRSEWSEALRVFIKYMDEGKAAAVANLENR